MRLAVLFLVFLGLLVVQGNDCPHRKAATLLPSFTVTTESTARPTTTSSGTGTTHPASNSTTTSPASTARPGNTTAHPSTSHGSTTATSPASTTRHGNTTAHPSTSHGTAPHPGPPPPSPSPVPGPDGAVGNYTWTNGSQPCAQLQAQIQIRVLYPSQGGKEAWGTSVLNPSKTTTQGDCKGAHPHLVLSFPYGQLTFGFKQDMEHSVVYLNYMAMEYNVSFPHATQWTFSAENSSLHDLQAPLGQSFSCRNSSIALSAAVHLDLLSLRLQAARLPHTGVFGPRFSCPDDQSFWLPLIIGLVLLGLLTLVLIAFCISRSRSSTYQAL